MTLNSEGLEKIKLCPLCRHVAREADPVHSTEGQIDSGYGPLSFGVECGADLECGCKVDGFPDQSSAIAAWNRRALPPVDGLEVVAWRWPEPMAEGSKFHSVTNAEPPCSGWQALVALSQASSVIAGLTKERDEAEEAENEAKDCFWAIYPEYLSLGGAPVSTEAARTKLATRISSLEEENGRLQRKLDLLEATVSFTRRWAIEKDGNGTSAEERLSAIANHPGVKGFQTEDHNG